MRRKPNLLYVFADQWRRQAVGIMNEDPVHTPNIDGFASQSLVFTEAVSCTPICSPHRSSLMTGKYALSTGVYTNCQPGLPVMLSPDETGIGDVLKDGGYETGYIGKWHLDLPEQNEQECPPSGARGWDAYTPPGKKRHGFGFWYAYGTFDDHMNPHYWTDSEQMITVDEWSVKHETDMALSFMERHAEGERPFALFLSWNPPHTPFRLVPDCYKKKYEGMELAKRENVLVREPFTVHTGEQIPGGEELWSQYIRDYYAAVTGIDEQFGRLLTKLEALGIAEDTIVVLTSDHGELMGSHGFMAKHSWHEESIGVPFFIRWPNGIAAGQTKLVLNTVDIMPTLLELTDLTVPQSVHGRSFANALRGGDEGQNEGSLGQAAYISAFPGRVAAIEAFRQAGLNHLNFGWRGVRTSRYTYVVNKGYWPGDVTERRLYDLVEDPYQLRPLLLEQAAQHPVAEQLEHILEGFLAQTKDGFDL